MKKAITRARYAQIVERVEVEDDDGSWLSFEAFYLKPPPGGRIAVWAEEEKVARRAYDLMGMGSR